MNLLKKILIVFGCLMVIETGAGAVELMGTVPVNVTSETSADAKNIALSQARRQILNQVLGRYANPGLVQVAIKNAKNSDLMDLVSSTSIDGEKLSDTAYSANITMYVDATAARRWLDANNIQNWLGSDGNSTDNKTLLFVTMSNRLANWIDLKRAARATGTDVDTAYIMGNNAAVHITTSKLDAFVNALRATGWKSGGQDGGIRIWK